MLVYTARGVVHPKRNARECSKLTTSTKILLRVAQTSTKIPALRTMVEATFLIVRRVDRQSIGRGMMRRYKSVTRLAANPTQTIGLETAAWQKSDEKLAAYSILTLSLNKRNVLPGSG